MTPPGGYAAPRAWDGSDQYQDPLADLDDPQALEDDDDLDDDRDADDDEPDGGPPRRIRNRPPRGPTDRGVVVEVALDPYILQEQMRAAGCSDLERQAVILWLMYRRAGHVARRLGLSRAKVIGMMAHARRRLRLWRARHNQGPAECQILAVYAEEVSRFGYQEEHHCAPGEEDCRQDGICKRRWYVCGLDTQAL